jgi:hypothetical protein
VIVVIEGDEHSNELIITFGGTLSGEADAHLSQSQSAGLYAKAPVGIALAGLALTRSDETE